MVFLRTLAVASWCLVSLAALTAEPAASGAPRAPAPPVHVVPASIDASGAHDVTMALQRELDRLPNGGTLRLRSRARYRVDGTLLIADRSHVTLDGAGAELFAGSRGAGDRSQLRIVGGTRITVRDVTITGANEHAGLGDAAYVVAMVGQHGIRIEGSSGVDLDRIDVRRVFGDFVYIGPDGPRWSDGIWIHDSRFDRSGRQGISVTAGRNVVIERNSIAYAHRAIVDLEPNGAAWGAENVHILDNTVGPSRLLFVAAAGRGPVDHVVIARNALRGHVLSVQVIASRGDRRDGFYVVDNRSDSDARRAPVRFTGVDGIVVTGNVQPITREGEPGVRLDRSCSVLVASNDLLPGTLQVSPPVSCGAVPALIPPAAPDVAGRNRSAAPGSPSEASTTTAPSRSAPASTGAGTSWARIVVVALLAVAVGGFVLRDAWRRDRHANERKRPPR